MNMNMNMDRNTGIRYHGLELEECFECCRSITWISSLLGTYSKKKS
jgi:hypothetical protein